MVKNMKDLKIKGKVGHLDSLIGGVVGKTTKGKTGKATPDSIVKNIKGNYK